jgi:glycosyltransferase involved in cell wall biosynthesis
MAAADGLSARRKIRVLYLLDGFPDPHAGTENQFWLLFRKLDRSRFEPAITLLKSSEFLQARVTDAPLETLGVVRLRSPRSLWRVFAAALRARTRGFDVVHLFFNDVSLVFPPLFRLFGIPVIVSRRDLGFWYTPGNLRLLRINARLAAAVVANCEAVRDAVIGAEHYDPRKVRVIYNGIGRNPSAARRDVRTELSVSADARLIIIVANLRPLKRIDDAVRALAVIGYGLESAHLVVAGEDRVDAAGRSVRAQLETLAAQLHVHDRLHFLGKIAEPLPVIRAADVCVLCSETEGLSNTVIEYMLAGKAAVCTRVGGNSELVIEGRTGHLVPVGDVQALAGAVSGLLRDPARARVYGEAARHRALELFRPEAMVGHHEALYTELAGR